MLLRMACLMSSYNLEIVWKVWIMVLWDLLYSVEWHVENNLEVEVLSIIERKAHPVTGSGREPSR